MRFGRWKVSNDKVAEIASKPAAPDPRDAEIARLNGLLDEATEALKRVPWAPRNKGVSGGAYFSDVGTDTSWAALEDRIETEASAFASHPGYRAVLDILEARLLGIWRRWKVADDQAEIARLHVHARCYEDMLATLEGATSLRARKESQARQEQKMSMERERQGHLASVGRSPFLR